MAVGVTALTRTAPQTLSPDEGPPFPPPAQP